MNEIGLDPGIDHLYAVKTISEVHAKGGKERMTQSLPPVRMLTVVADQALPLVLRWTSRPRVLRQSARL